MNYLDSAVVPGTNEQVISEELKAPDTPYMTPQGLHTLAFTILLA